MKFLGKMCLLMILKVIKKNRGFTLSLEDAFSKNHMGCQINPSSSRLRIKKSCGTHRKTLVSESLFY